MLLHFTKMEGLGNDYIYIDCTKQQITDPAGLAKRLSNRHYGIGSDGIILICSSENADFMMDMYNADGSRSEMCGNGIRCMAKYVHDYKLTAKTSFLIETLAGTRQVKLLDTEGQVSHVRVNMGFPVLKASDIPALIEDDAGCCIGQSIQVLGQRYNITCVSMGNPHCVIFTENVEDINVERVGAAIGTNSLFPKKTNVEFVEPCDSTHMRLRVWERGTGETMACGTGACAALVAGALNGCVGAHAVIELRGGTLSVSWDGLGSCVYMTGAARTVYDGTVYI